MRLLLISLIFATSLFSEELKVVADSFEADEKRGISVFSANVTITKDTDVMKASKITIHIDKERHPVKYIAEGDVTFSIKTEDNSSYKGKAQKAVFSPDEKEYKFSGNVELHQLDEKKTIIGDVVFVNMLKGTAIAQGAKNRPVIMTFELKEKK
jgi:lipopolysaccharide export system protein LptA